MYEISHISNVIGEAYVVISLKKLEEILEELQQAKKQLRDYEHKHTGKNMEDSLG